MSTAELPLTGREVLTTTRCVRKRLDLSRPVDRALIEEAVGVALQAPTGSFSQIARFICVDDPGTRRELGEIYRRGWAVYEQTPVYAGRMPLIPGLEAMRDRAVDSAKYLVEHMGEAPVLVVPVADLTSDTGRRFVEAGYTRDAVHPAVLQAALWGSVMPEAWSFMLALRSLGLASCWTVVHMFFEQEAADLLGIPFESVIQAALIPVAHPLGGASFHPGPRMPADMAVRWNSW